MGYLKAASAVSGLVGGGKADMLELLGINKL